VTPQKLIRIGLAVVLVVVALFAKEKFPHLTDGLRALAARVTPNFVVGVAIVSEILLAILIGVLLWDRFIRLRHCRSYDEQMGRGITNALLVFVLAVAAVLAIGAFYRSRVIVLGIGYCTIGLSLWLVGGLITEGIKSLRKRRR